MGYNGLGMQRWISTMKPRKFLGKRSKPDGGGGDAPAGSKVSSFYHIKKRNFDKLKSKKYSKAYRQKLKEELDDENKKSYQNMTASIVIAIIFVLLIIAYFNSKLNWF